MIRATTPLAALALLVAAPVPAATLCARSETVAFSCKAGAHVISVCETDGGRQMQYRYGTSGKIALAYPATGTPAASTFTGGTLMYSGGGGAWLRFANGAYSYTVFTAIGKWGANESPATAAGVVVEKDGAPLANISCTGRDTGELGPDLFDRAGLPQSDDADAFEIPESMLPN